MRDATVAAVEGITGLKVIMPEYIPRDQIPYLSDKDLVILLDTWRSTNIPVKPIHTWSKRLKYDIIMGLPLLNEVERRWRESLESEDA